MIFRFKIILFHNFNQEELRKWLVWDIFKKRYTVWVHFIYFVNHIFEYLIQLNSFPFKMMKVNALAVPYLLVFFDLCLVNNQHPDGMIKLKQGNLIGVRNYSLFLIYCVSLTNIYSVNCAFFSWKYFQKLLSQFMLFWAFHMHSHHLDHWDLRYVWLCYY